MEFEKASGHEFASVYCTLHRTSDRTRVHTNDQIEMSSTLITFLGIFALDRLVK
jgi:hypothetical protein